MRVWVCLTPGWRGTDPTVWRSVCQVLRGSCCLFFLHHRAASRTRPSIRAGASLAAGRGCSSAFPVMLLDTRRAYLYIANYFDINRSDISLQSHLNSILRVIIDARPPFYAFRPNRKQERAHFTSFSLNVCLYCYHTAVFLHRHSYMFIGTFVLVHGELSVCCIYYHGDGLYNSSSI